MIRWRLRGGNLCRRDLHWKNLGRSLSGRRSDRGDECLYDRAGGHHKWRTGSSLVTGLAIGM